MNRFTSKGFTLVELMIVMVMVIVGILAALAIPQYQTYVFKSQVQRVVGEASALKMAVELCLASGRVNVGDTATAGNCDPQATGSNLQATSGNSAPTVASPWATPGTGVPEVTLSGTVPATIIATFGNLAGVTLQGSSPGTITWRRESSGAWTCRSANIEAKYVSAACPL